MGGSVSQQTTSVGNTQFGAPQNQMPSGKGGQQVQGMQGASTNSATSGQPNIGSQNPYSNTVGQWDNAQIRPTNNGGKGKGV
jgi:hypothetical protein